MAHLTKIIWSKHKFYELWMIQSQDYILWLWMGSSLLEVLDHWVGDLATWSEEALPPTILFLPPLYSCLRDEKLLVRVSKDISNASSSYILPYILWK